MQIKTTSTTGDRVAGALRGVLPYHVYSAAELGVEQHRQGNGLPQVVTGYDPDPLQTTLIQSVAQQLVQTVTVTHEHREQRKKTIHSPDKCQFVLLYCCDHVKLIHLKKKVSGIKRTIKKK